MPGMAELFKRKGSGASNNGKHGAAASAERGDPNFVAVEGASMTMYDADNDGRIDHVERTLAKYDLVTSARAHGLRGGGCVCSRPFRAVL